MIVVRWNSLDIRQHSSWRCLVMAITSAGLVHHDADSKTPAEAHSARSAPYRRRSPSMNGTTSTMAKTWLASIHQFNDQPVRPQNLAAISSPGATCCSSRLNTARKGSAVLATSYLTSAGPASGAGCHSVAVTHQATPEPGRAVHGAAVAATVSGRIAESPPLPNTQNHQLGARRERHRQGPVVAQIGGSASVLPDHPVTQCHAV